jgi:DNA-directed RNA polymerase subunit RPC12/RpoP
MSEPKRDLHEETGVPYERVRISCPGCGRSDYVRWPAGRPVYHWKCFNCSKEFDLTREAGHSPGSRDAGP